MRATARGVAIEFHGYRFRGLCASVRLPDCCRRRTIRLHRRGRWYRRRCGDRCFRRTRTSWRTADRGRANDRSRTLAERMTTARCQDKGGQGQGRTTVPRDHRSLLHPERAAVGAADRRLAVTRFHQRSSFRATRRPEGLVGKGNLRQEGDGNRRPHRPLLRKAAGASLRCDPLSRYGGARAQSTVFTHKNGEIRHFNGRFYRVRGIAKWRQTAGPHPM